MVFNDHVVTVKTKYSESLNPANPSAQSPAVQEETPSEVVEQEDKTKKSRKNKED